MGSLMKAGLVIILHNGLMWFLLLFIIEPHVVVVVCVGGGVGGKRGRKRGAGIWPEYRGFPTACKERDAQ